MTTYILWTSSGKLFSLGPINLDWQGLLLILAFVSGRLLLGYVFRKEGKPEREVDILFVALIVAALIGARLTHVILFQPRLWNTPLEVFFPFRFSPAFHFTGMGGFSTHGAAFGGLIGLWIYTKSRKNPIGFFPLLDRVSMVATWAAIPILIGSFLHSEIDGKPTSSPVGVVFTHPVTSGLTDLPCCIMRNPGGKNPLISAVASKNNDSIKLAMGQHALSLYFFFKAGTPLQTIDEFLLGDVKTYLYDMSFWVDEPGTKPLHYAVIQQSNGDFDARVRTIGIARYPIQLFEALICTVVFVALIVFWNRHKGNTSNGIIAGFALFLIWTSHLLFEFMKVKQPSFFPGFILSKGQILSIVLILIGLVALVRSYRSLSR